MSLCTWCCKTFLVKFRGSLTGLCDVMMCLGDRQLTGFTGHWRQVCVYRAPASCLRAQITVLVTLALISTGQESKHSCAEQAAPQAAIQGKKAASTLAQCCPTCHRQASRKNGSQRWAEVRCSQCSQWSKAALQRAGRLHSRLQTSTEPASRPGARAGRRPPRAVSGLRKK